MSINLPLRRTALQYTTSTLTKTTPTTTTTSTTPTTTFICTQCRHATLLRRPKRPYTFTQLITLSDGSTFLHRTTSPQSVYRSTRDTKNAPLWNPTSEKLLNVEKDEAGRLAAFRNKFGRGFDAGGSGGEGKSGGVGAGEGEGEGGDKAKKAQAEEDAKAEEEEDDYFLDLISTFGQEQDPQLKGGKLETKKRR
ncbi:hypothetical protein FQN54_000417 [Arachnomyces sp. PD_36]|nr:hypothetical protein FQN54_000417 [Arachnomyces sp. PD_36]